MSGFCLGRRDGYAAEFARHLSLMRDQARWRESHAGASASGALSAHDFATAYQPP